MKKLLLSALLLLALSLPSLSEETMMGDFEDEKELSNWKPGFNDASSKETPPELSISKENATSGSNSLKLTFSDGLLPMISTSVIPNPESFYAYKGFCFDLTVPRDTMAGVKFVQDAKFSFDARVMVKKGLNKINIMLAPPSDWGRGGGIDPKGGPVKEIQIYFFKPKKDEAYFLDRIRVTDRLSKKAASNFEHLVNPWYKSTFTVLGGKKSEQVGLKDLNSAMADGFYEKQLGTKTTEEMEKQILAKYDEIKKSNPGAALSVFRNGAAGYDTKFPATIYSGWNNAYISTHSPDSGMTLIPMTGGSCELFMRHRVQLFSADLSAIPAGSQILQAYFVLVSNKKTTGACLYIAEAINRDWKGPEVTAYTYDKDKFWNFFGGLTKTGDDPDCFPLILAYGYRKELIAAWDFTEAVKYWTDGKNANHGFFFPCLEGNDYCSTATIYAGNIKERPGMYVIYNPK